MNSQEVFGGVVALMRHSPIHCRYTVRDLDRLIIPPLMLDQYAVVANDAGCVTGFASWAYLTKGTLDAFRDGTNHLEPQDWAAGTIQFLVDVIAPEGRYVRPLIAEIKRAIKGPIVFRRNYSRNRSRMGRAFIPERS